MHKIMIITCCRDCVYVILYEAYTTRQEYKFKINIKIALVRYFSEILITYLAELYEQTCKYLSKSLLLE